MNIFILDNCPKKAAIMHIDKHLIKMILETAQLLSTCHRVLDGVKTVGLSKKGRKSTKYTLPDSREEILYKSTHVNHPCSVWLRQSNENYNWLFSLYESLLQEYQYRYGRVHKCSNLYYSLKYPPNKITYRYMTDFAQAMPDEYKNEDAVEAYREFYIKDKSKKMKMTWKKRNVPEWYKEQANANV